MSLDDLHADTITIYDNRKAAQIILSTKYSDIWNHNYDEHKTVRLNYTLNRLCFWECKILLLNNILHYTIIIKSTILKWCMSSEKDIIILNKYNLEQRSIIIKYIFLYHGASVFFNNNALFVYMLQYIIMNDIIISHFKMLLDNEQHKKYATDNRQYLVAYYDNELFDRSLRNIWILSCSTI